MGGKTKKQESDNEGYNHTWPSNQRPYFLPEMCLNKTASQPALMFQISSRMGAICHGAWICFCTALMTIWLSPSTFSQLKPACNAVLIPSRMAVASATRIEACSRKRDPALMNPPCQLRRMWIEKLIVTYSAKKFTCLHTDLHKGSPSIPCYANFPLLSSLWVLRLKLWIYLS